MVKVNNEGVDGHKQPQHQNQEQATQLRPCESYKDCYKTVPVLVSLNQGCLKVKHCVGAECDPD